MLFFRHKAAPPQAEDAPVPADKLAAETQAAFLDEHGLYHQWYLEQRLREEVARAGRTGNKFSIVAWHWKLLPNEAINPNLLPRAVAAILKGLRWYDVASRMEPQRFVAVLFDSDYEAAATIAYRVKTDLQIRLPAAGTWQVGIASFGRDGVDSDSVLQAMFHSLETDVRSA